MRDETALRFISVNKTALFFPHCLPCQILLFNPLGDLNSGIVGIGFLAGIAKWQVGRALVDESSGLCVERWLFGPYWSNNQVSSLVSLFCLLATRYLSGYTPDKTSDCVCWKRPEQSRQTGFNHSGPTAWGLFRGMIRCGIPIYRKARTF